ncbi:V-type ATPase subunit [Oscillibacter sp. MSJ-2]|uniref:V-type ATPase subunit n=1 Tax=Dysosmobacter acutus TaxID=2841504 RepID=A0ABS6F721_9FIRM|nr:V-type ATPase subunit [Dysosmobacter acutus]MBU5626076.1 V-type ATPase subunit [Dysosmobacter acutus]
MLTSFSSKAIMTKCKAMYGQHLTVQQYQDMMHCSGVSAIASYLKEEPAYQQALASVRPDAVYRAQLERMLRKSRHAQYAGLMRYDFSASDSFYRCLMRRGEIEQILELIRLLNAGCPERFAKQYPVFLERGASFSFEALAQVRDFSQLLRVLERTSYAKALAPFQSEGPDQSIDYTGCETALYADYYRRLEQSVDQLFRGRVRSQLHELIETHVELINIRAIYRMKTFFPEAGPDRIRGLLLPSWRRSSGMEQLLSAPTAGEFRTALSESRYCRYFGPDDLSEIDYRADRVEYHLARRFMHFASDAPTAFMAFMVLTQLELENIVTIIEGVRYGTPPEEIASMLIL